jgi:protein-tyrosine-phosphatase
MDRPYNVLFLCTGNSARSIIGEAILNKIGAGNFRAYSAGSQPKGQINPNTIQLLQNLGYDTSEYRSKSWDEFAKEGQPKFDFVFTVCDSAAAEACPVWPGQPMTAHWGIEDPAAAAGSDLDKERAFNLAFRELDARIKIFTSLRLEALDELALRRQLEAIGKLGRETDTATKTG